MAPTQLFPQLNPRIFRKRIESTCKESTNNKTLQSVAKLCNKDREERRCPAEQEQEIIDSNTHTDHPGNGKVSLLVKVGKLPKPVIQT